MTIASGLFATLIALIGAWIAYNQWRTNHDKLMLDLFDRRFEIYVAILRFLSGILQEGQTDYEKAMAILPYAQRSRFLFGPEVEEYIKEEIYKPAIKMTGLRKSFQALEVGEERTRLVMQEADLSKYFTDEIVKLSNRFDPYLAVYHRTNLSWIFTRHRKI